MSWLPFIGQKSRNYLLFEPPVDPVALSIYNSLVGWWNFDDNNAGGFLDSHAANPLTPVLSSLVSTSAANSEVNATFNAGGLTRHYGIIADFAVNRFQHAYIPRANTNFDLNNESFTAFGWTAGSPTALAGARHILSRVVANTGGRQWGIFIGSLGSRIFGAVFDTAFVPTIIDTGFDTSGTSMYFYAFGLDRSNNLIRFRIKGPGTFSAGAPRDINLTTPFLSAMNFVGGTANFTFGEMFSNDNTYESAFQRNYEDSGRWSCAGFVRGLILTDAQFDFLYNAGAGIPYSTLATAAGH